MTRNNLTSFVLTIMIISLSATIASAGKVWLDPEILNLEKIGSIGTMTVRIEGVAEIAGVELYITYNTKVVKVVSTPVPGVCPKPELKIYNDFNNETGLVRYTVSTLKADVCDSAASPNLPIVAITFERIGPGNANIKFSLDKKDAGISIIACKGVQTLDNSTPESWKKATITGEAAMSKKPTN